MKLVDTSSWIEYLRHLDSAPSLRVEDLVTADDAGWCDLIVIDLWNGARGRREKGLLAELEREITHFAIDGAVWRRARDLAINCRAAGFTAPAADIVIVACTRHYGLELEHCDAHFPRILALS